MSEDIRNLIEQGKYFFTTQNYKKAEELFKEVIAKKKEFADVLNCMGIIYHEKGKYSQAIKYFERALKKNPRYTEVLLNLSILYNDMGEYDKAKKLVAKSKKDAKKTKTAMDPFIRSKLANKHAEVGDWYKGVGAYAPAIDEYKKALGLEPKYADIRTKMAVCLRETGKEKDALKEFKQAVKDNPKFLDAQIQLGVTQYALGKKTEARKVWNAVHKKAPKDKTVKMYLKFTK